MGRTDPRRLVFFGVLWMGGVTLWRSIATTDMGFWDVATPLVVMGFGLPFFFIPTTGLALSSVDEHEMDSAAGLMNFLRTLSGAFATSLVTTVWDNKTTTPNSLASRTVTRVYARCWNRQEWLPTRSIRPSTT